VAAPPTAAFVLLATAVTLALARRWPAWSAPGHAAFAAIVISSTAFLVYAARTAVLGSPAMSGYDVSGGETVEHVQSPGAALGHGFRVAASRVSFAVTPGLEARHTTREEGARDRPERARYPTSDVDCRERPRELRSGEPLLMAARSCGPTAETEQRHRHQPRSRRHGPGQRGFSNNPGWIRAAVAAARAGPQYSDSSGMVAPLR
jgi:hypothetical protein